MQRHKPSPANLYPICFDDFFENSCSMVVYYDIEGRSVLTAFEMPWYAGLGEKCK